MEGKDCGHERQKAVYLFLDEFSNYLEAKTGMAAYLLLNGLGYKVRILKHKESGRTYITKGMLRKARAIARSNVRTFASLVSKETPLIGIEPSSLLTFRDEYIDLLSGELKEQSRELSQHTFLIDEFLAGEYASGKIDRNCFTREKKHILLHGHCQQKAIASTRATHVMLSIPGNYTVEEIPSGCCGMAGSFGYEKEHIDLSMKIGELVLFPAVRNAGENTVICANGTSCRQQIMDGTGRKAYHPAEVLYEALKG
jgi:Fe-S oxidoreductase